MIVACGDQSRLGRVVLLGALAEHLRQFRNHDIECKVRKRQATWRQDTLGFGFNHSLTDLQSALGPSQSRRLDVRLKRREKIATRYHIAAVRRTLAA